MRAIEEKKSKFREFLKLMGVKSSKTDGQSWNDNF